MGCVNSTIDQKVFKDQSNIKSNYNENPLPDKFFFLRTNNDKDKDLYDISYNGEDEII